MNDDIQKVLKEKTTVQLTWYLEMCDVSSIE